MRSSPTFSYGFSAAALIVWLCLVIAGGFGIQWLVRHERDREIAGWQARLSLISAAQSRGIAGWLGARSESLARLSENVSLKLYMTELPPTPGTADQPEPAQRTFLRNLLISTARENGFTSVQSLPSVPANMDTPASPGLLLMDASLRPVVATPGMISADTLPTPLRAAEYPRQALFFGPFPLGKDANARAVAFRLPIYPVQASAKDAAPIGFVIGVAQLDAAFASQLKELTPSQSTSESLLLAYRSPNLIYFSPRLDGVSYLSQQPKSEALAELQALRAPGKMVSSEDYRGEKVFAVASAVQDTDWFLVRKIDRRVALAEASQRSLWLHLSYALAIGFVTALLIALWRHASALQATRTAEEMETLAHTIERQEKLLDLIADTTPISTYIVDQKQQVRYANRKAAESAGMQREAMLGKTLDDVLGKARAEPVIAGNKLAEERRGPFHAIEKTEAEGMLASAIERQHLPLDFLPLSEDGAPLHGILVIENDVTELVRSQEKHQRVLQQLIRSLVTIVDRRDPHAAHHSSTVAALARGVAVAMGADAATVGTAETAGRLMNIGKILIPEDVLAAESLKETDKKKIRDSILASADFLKEIDFEGPVVETIRQSQERFDGNGPRGLSGENILLSARIVAACNALAAMASDRAYRQKKSLEDAIKTLFAEADKAYDRRVVAALVHYVENGEGKALLAKQ